MRRPPLDGLVVPALLLLIARELALYDPTRELAWPLFHELAATTKPAWLEALLPRPAAVLYDDPVALLLATLATLVATAYAAAALLGAGPKARGALLGLAAALLVALPTAGAIGLGLATGRPYGHDGGVVQLPLALERVLAGQSPYGADYSQSVLGEQSRDSVFWRPLGGNPITKHHWYLPGMHLVMAPFYLLSRFAFGHFEPRLVTLPAYALLALLAARLFPDTERRLAAAGLVLFQPLLYWPQVFGTNDALSAVPLLLGAWLARRERPVAAALCLGLAAAVKQLSWPFLPFLLVYAAGLGSFDELRTRAGLVRLLRLTAVAAAVFLGTVLPVALRDWSSFVADILRYQTGAPGSDQYPLGGTPGFGFANLLIYAGEVRSLQDFYPFSRFFLLFVPAGLLLLRFQFRSGGLSAPLAAGSAALLLSLYFSRIPNPNYVALAALFLPLALLLRPRLGLDTVLVPLLLLGLALEGALHQILRTTWEDGLGAGLPELLLPDPGGPRWRDPLSTGWSGVLAAAGLVYLLAALLGLGRRGRGVLLALAAILALGLPLRAITQGALVAGVVRAQDRFLAEAVEAREAPGPAAWGQRPGVARTPVLEMWPASWRRDPPREWLRNLSAPGAYTAGRLSRAADVDPRTLALVLLALVALGVARWGPPGARLAIAGTLLLSPPLAVGLLAGAGSLWSAALVLAALLIGPARSLLAGAAAAPLPPLFVAGLALARSPLVLALGLFVASAPLFVGYPVEFWRVLARGAHLAPSLGLTNLLFYRPDLPAVLEPILRGAGSALLAGLAVALWWRGAFGACLASTATLASAALLAGPGASGHAVAVPVLLFLLAGLVPPEKEA